MTRRKLILTGLALALIVPAALLLAQSRSERMIDLWRMGEWGKTDFTKYAVDLGEIMSGGPPRDGIPPIDEPRFVTAEQAAEWLDDGEPVMVYRHGGEVKAYPIQILIWHEIVNDTVGGRPVVITFCPLCNSAIAFDRRVDGRELTFGTTGKLRMSDLIMWDRQTESWWQQLTGEGIVGTYTGRRLTFLSSPMVSFKTYRENFPQGQVLSRNTGHSRSYGNNPYASYDSPGNSPFLFRGERDDRLPAMERVVALERNGQFRAYPYSKLAKVGLAEETFAGLPIVVFHAKGTRTALGRGDMAGARDVGAVGVFERELDGRRLSFRRVAGGFEDKETGSRWNLLGRSTAGRLKGKQLKAVIHANHFAFAWFAFRPETTVW